jgi:predicted TIM-barrel fold metal-dependent hydrolase
MIDTKVIDTDTHLIEPPDLWTSRLSSKWGNRVPHVLLSADDGLEWWFIGDEKVIPVALLAQAGWTEFPPDHPPGWTDVDPATWDAVPRLALMDRYGIYAQVLYPNVALFKSAMIQGTSDTEFMCRLIEAYNDYQTEWCSAAPDRLLAITVLPFWDLDATIREMERCSAAGHHGVVFSQEPAGYGLPALADRHWDRLWAAAQSMDLSINFHIASNNAPISMHPDTGRHANAALAGANLFLGNARTIGQLIMSGICHRFPKLKFVSVESGIGWVPFMLDALDWQWKNYGVHLEHPEYDLLPSEYFQRQIWGCFWFEEEGASYAIERLGADKVLYETDFPHATSMSPGPASLALAPNEFLERNFSHLSDQTLRKILYDNAAKIYHLD